MNTCYLCNKHIIQSLAPVKTKVPGKKDSEFSGIIETHLNYLKLVEHNKKYDRLLNKCLGGENEIEGRVSEREGRNVLQLKSAVEELQKKKQSLLQKVEQMNQKTSSLELHKELLSQQIHLAQEKSKRLALKQELINALQSTLANRIEYLSFYRAQQAIKLFQAMPIVIDSQGMMSKTYQQHLLHHNTQLRRNWKLTGCCTINNFPLPNNGCFENLPLDILCTGIFHIVHLVDSLASVLQVILPHRMTLYGSYHGPTISPQYEQHLDYVLFPVLSSPSRNTTAISSASASMIVKTKIAIDWNTLHAIRYKQQQKQRKQPKDNKVQQIQQEQEGQEEEEGEGGESDYLLNASFYPALALLQANIVVLCIQMEIPAERLFPPMAMLLNLLLLQHHLLTRTKVKVKTISNSNTHTTNSIDDGDGDVAGAIGMGIEAILQHKRHSIFQELQYHHYSTSRLFVLQQHQKQQQQAIGRHQDKHMQQQDEEGLLQDMHFYPSDENEGEEEYVDVTMAQSYYPLQQQQQDENEEESRVVDDTNTPANNSIMNFALMDLNNVERVWSEEMEENEVAAVEQGKKDEGTTTTGDEDEWDFI